MKGYENSWMITKGKMLWSFNKFSQLFVTFWLLDYFSSIMGFLNVPARKNVRWEIRRHIPFCPCYWHTLRRSGPSVDKNVHKIGSSASHIKKEAPKNFWLSHENWAYDPRSNAFSKWFWITNSRSLMFLRERRGSPRKKCHTEWKVTRGEKD